VPHPCDLRIHIVIYPSPDERGVELSRQSMAATIRLESRSHTNLCMLFQARKTSQRVPFPFDSAFAVDGSLKMATVSP
jgi:hypothetical protein